MGGLQAGGWHSHGEAIARLACLMKEELEIRLKAELFRLALGAGWLI